MFVRPERIVATALRLRASLGQDGVSPTCPFQIAEALGISVRLMSVPSLEGLYRPAERPTIIVGAQRPFGRRNFTCAHELGHHVHGHGYRIDEVTEHSARVQRPAQEYVADRFAAALLMPKLCVLTSFSIRGASHDAPDHLVTAIVADELGVGYRTLVRYMRGTLLLFDVDEERRLLKATPKGRRVALLENDTKGRLVVVDHHWRRQSIDLEVGDVVLPPPGSRIDGVAVVPFDSKGASEARAPGTGALWLPGREAPVAIRVSQKWFNGIARYRFLEDDDDDEPT